MSVFAIHMFKETSSYLSLSCYIMAPCTLDLKNVDFTGVWRFFFLLPLEALLIVFYVSLHIMTTTGVFCQGRSEAGKKKPFSMVFSGEG